ncbi:MAG: flagellar hook-associated protein FlgK [Pseudomonadota bacterium]
MASGIFGIGTSGLLTAQQQIATTGHNISNVNTAGYARQRTEVSSSLPNFSGSGYTGTGVQIDTTRRFYDEFLEKQIRSSNSQLGRFERFNELAGQIDNILANPDAGLTPTIEDFYNALQEANDFPSSVPARSVLVTSANTLVDRFSLLQDRFIDLNNQTNSNLADVADEVTARAASIAELNQQISLQIGAGNGNLPNDAMDQREQLIKEISERIDVNVVYQSNGAVNLFIGSGQSLVLNSTAFTMSVRDGEYSPKDKEIFLSNTNTEINITSQIKGGELQGLVDFKKQVLEPSFNSLGRIAASISSEMNDQHSLGLTLQKDATGNYIQGGNFFNDITAPQSTFSSTTNIGNAGFDVNITDTSALTTSDYELEFTFAAGVYTYSMTRLSDNATFTGSSVLSNAAALVDLNGDLANTTLPSGNSINSPQGISISLASGAVTSGDRFFVQPTHELSRDIGVNVTDVLDIALASPIAVSEASDALGVGTNTGTGTMEFVQFEAPNGNLTNIPISDALGAYTNIVVTYNGTGFDISSAAPAAVPAVAAGPIAYNPVTDSGATLTLGAPYDSISFKVTGAPATGDSFLIGNNQSPQDDNRNGLIMASIQAKKTIQNGSADFQRAYGLMVADVGTRTHSSEVDLRAQTTLNDQAKQNRDSLSGVNLDEEASNLLRFQQAYQASAKVITVANDIFSTLLNTIG